jgi:peroxiredoxin
MTLQQQIEKMQEALLPMIPKNILDTLVSTTRELVESGIADKGLKKGERIPWFELPNATGSKISSDRLLQKGPLVISFYRGSWCPYCNVEFRAMQEHLPQINEAGAKLVAISPELPDNSLTLTEKYNLEFELLSDEGNGVARQFGLVFALAEEVRPIYADFGFHIPSHNGDESWEIPIPATYIVNRDGTILHAYVNANYTQRMEPVEIVEVLRKQR